MAEAPGEQAQIVATPDKETQPDKGTEALQRFSSRAPMIAVSLSVLAFIVATTVCALYALPNLKAFVEESPHERASVPILDPAVSAALKNVQSSQQQDAALLRKNAATLEQNSAVLESLRLSSTDERSDLKRISDQLSSLVTKADALQNAVTLLTTSAIQKPRARIARTSGRELLRLPKPIGPVSVGGAPLSPVPAPRSG